MDGTVTVVRLCLMLPSALQEDEEQIKIRWFALSISRSFTRHNSDLEMSGTLCIEEW